MKYKNKLNSRSFIYIISIFILCSVIIGGLIYIDEKIMAIIITIVLLILIYIYLFPVYIIDSNFFIVKYGLLKIKYKYENISSLTENKHSVTINFKKIGFHINTINNEEFVNNIRKNMKVVK